MGLQEAKPPEMFVFFSYFFPISSIIDILVPPANTSFVILHGKAPFQFGARCAKCDWSFYGTILNIKRFDIALKYCHFKIKKMVVKWLLHLTL